MLNLYFYACQMLSWLLMQMWSIVTYFLFMLGCKQKNEHEIQTGQNG